LLEEGELAAQRRAGIDMVHLVSDVNKDLSAKDQDKDKDFSSRTGTRTRT